MPGNVSRFVYFSTYRGLLARGVLVAGMACGPAADGTAQQRTTYNLYGMPGLLDMPTALSAPDGELAATLAILGVGDQARGTLSFQVTPRLTAAFRYASIDNYLLDGERTFDRSFDIHYRFIDEGTYRPAVAIGLRDFLGTGLYSSEYVVATKHITDRFTVTGGMGWGRLGTEGGFSNPLGAISSSFDNRSTGGAGTGGSFDLDNYFSGNAAFFAGIRWAATDKLTLLAEYSSDAYELESTRGLPEDRYEHNSPINLGLSYRLRPGTTLTAAYLNGSTLAVSANFTLNPKNPPNKGSLGPAPIPVKARPSRTSAPADWGTGWVTSPERTGAIRGGIGQVLAAEGITLEALELSGTQAHVRIRNNRYSATPQAIGRTARVLTQILPASVEVFRIEPVVEGIPVSTTTIRRSDMEALENAPDAAWLSYTRAQIGAAPQRNIAPEPGLYPRLSWGLAPYLGTSFFDPDGPVRADIGVELSARYDISPGASVSGALRQPLGGNLDGARGSDSVLPPVRTNANLYNQADGPLIDHLTFDYVFSPREDLYGRFTVGYLEQMFGGVSAELLWQPVDSKLALGVELNYVQQRDFDQQFGFQDYNVATGHASAYYDFSNGFHGQLDVGRYLAGDWGATFALDREFKNGWKVGGYFTLTDVSSEDFGEGSFDKGIRITMPLDWVLGQPTRKTIGTTIRPTNRDGGARLNVRNRLYEQVRELRDPELRDRWGTFWK